MAQYHAGRNEFVDRNNELYDVVLLGNEVGGIMTNRYAQDAWGRPKSVQDFSLFSGTWTHSVPARVWEEINYDLVTPANNTAKPQMVNATSKHGMLSVTSGTTPNAGTVLRSKKYVRYQPNRGQLYSTAITCPNPTGKGFRTWGLGTARDGFYFGMFGTGSDWDIKVSRWRDVPDSNIQHLDGATAASALNTAFQADKTAGVMMQVFSEFSAKDSKTEIVNPSENSEFALTPGDILVICGAGLQNTGQSYATTVYYSEQL